MSRHDPRVTLAQMLASAREARDLVWDILTLDLPDLIVKLEQMLSEEESA